MEQPNANLQLVSFVSVFGDTLICIVSPTLIVRPVKFNIFLKAAEAFTFLGQVVGVKSFGFNNLPTVTSSNCIGLPGYALPNNVNFIVSLTL